VVGLLFGSSCYVTLYSCDVCVFNHISLRKNGYDVIKLPEKTGVFDHILYVMIVMQITATATTLARGLHMKG